MAGQGMWRSRWAAVGAAVAVTIGAGGIYSVGAATDPSSFVAITPVRVLDTRIGAGLDGAFTSGTPRQLDVTGTIEVVDADGVTVGSGSPVPEGATAIVANVTAVFPSTAGFVAVRPGDATGAPTTSSVNFTSGGVVSPNSVTVELPTSGAQAGTVQLFFQGTASSATTDLLVDIVGYYVAAADDTDQVPPGETVTGVASWNLSASAGGELMGASVMLPALASGPLAANMVNFGPDANPNTIDDDATCTGTADVPTAPPGKVCLYLYGSGNAQSIEGYSLQQLPDHGFYIDWTSAAAGSTYVYSTWAYTAP